MSLRSIWYRLRLPWRTNAYRGSDLDGNMYFEGPPIHQGGKPRRKVIYYVNRSIEQYNPEDIPPMWRAWLTHTRNTAPLIQELQADEIRLRTLRERVQQIEEKEKSLRLPQVRAEESNAKLEDLNTVGEAEYTPENWTPSSNR